MDELSPLMNGQPESDPTTPVALFCLNFCCCPLLWNKICEEVLLALQFLLYALIFLSCLFGIVAYVVILPIVEANQICNCELFNTDDIYDDLNCEDCSDLQ
jgi:hypothetical protein